MSESKGHNSAAVNKDVLKSFTDRVARMMAEKKEQDEEFKEDIKEIKAEIKGRVEETGVDPDLVMFCAKTRLAELDARMKLMTDVSYMDLYDSIYGVNVDITAVADEAAEEPDPLG
jgi:uncharacterized protein (UPF0335 family)